MIFQELFKDFMNLDPNLNLINFFLIFFPLILYFFSLFSKKDVFLKIFASITLLFVSGFYILNFIIFIPKNYFFSILENPIKIHLFSINRIFDFDIVFNFFGLTFLIISYVLCFLTILYSISYCKIVNISFSKLIRLILLAIFSVNLIALAGNIFVSFVGYEILSIVTYFLIISQNKDSNAPYIGKKYLNLLLIFSSIFFVIILILSSVIFNGNLDFDFIQLNSNEFVTKFEDKKYFFYSLIALLACFASLKAAIFPFHFWLPHAMIAHLPVSAILHAALVVKGGIIVIFQIIFLKIGIENFQKICSSNLSINFLEIPKILSGIGIIYLSFMAIRKSEMKRIFAYSTAAQLNYIILSFFNIICNIKDFPNNSNFNSPLQIQFFVLMQICLHAFAKINLFFCSGYFYEKYKIKYKNEYKGLFYKEKFVSCVFLISCFSLLGFPFFPGFFGKINLIELVVDSKSLFSLFCITIGFLFSCYYFLPILYDMFFSQNFYTNENLENVKKSKFAWMKIAIYFCAIILIFLTFFNLFYLLTSN